MFSSRPHFGGRIGRAPDRLELPAHRPLMTVQTAVPATMVVLCEGGRGRGFRVCTTCGAGFPGIKRKHRTPYGQECDGILTGMVSLGHELVTDVLQIDFLQPGSGRGKNLGYSLAFAILEGTAEVLEVPSADLNATVRGRGGGGTPTVILYDTVPGGAGLAARLEDEAILHECLLAARNRVAGACRCRPEDSCYGCLRSFRNQFVHADLSRGAAYEYLNSVLSRWE